MWCAGVPDTALSRQLTAETVQWQAASLAKSTRQQYDKHWEYWIRFLLVLGVLWRMYTPDEYLLCMYVAWLARSCAYHTVVQYVKGLKASLVGAGITWMGGMQLQSVLLGVKNDKGMASQVKLAIHPYMLVEMSSMVWGRDLEELAAFTCMVLGVFSFLRKSNLVVDGVSLSHGNKVLRRCDVVFDQQKYCLWLTVRFTKTLKHRERVHTVAVQGVKGGVLDPVHWWLRYQRAVPAGSEEPAFGSDVNGTYVPLTYTRLVHHIKALVTTLGLDASKFSSHSLRRGGASFAFLCSVQRELIQMQGDWKSDAYQRYLQFDEQQKLSVTAAMQEALQKGKYRSELSARAEVQGCKMPGWGARA